MKKTIITISLGLLFSFSIKAQTGDVLLRVSGISTELGGRISSGIFKKGDFPKVGKQFRGKNLDVVDKEMEVLLEKVPVGTYGAVVFQDTSEDSKLDANFVGLPTEPIGFANDARIRFGPPSFEDASITVVEGETVVVKINLK